MKNNHQQDNRETEENSKKGTESKSDSKRLAVSHSDKICPAETHPEVTIKKNHKNCERKSSMEAFIT